MLVRSGRKAPVITEVPSATIAKSNALIRVALKRPVIFASVRFAFDCASARALHGENADRLAYGTC